MRSLVTLSLALVGIFLLLFLVVEGLGWITLADVERWLEHAHEASQAEVAGLVVLLLVLDLFLTVPTLPVTLLAGHFLGFVAGSAASVAGMFGAGFLGYGLGRRHGVRWLARWVKDEDQLAEQRRLCHRYGAWVLVLARAIPMLPEVTCLVAGANRMPFARFSAAYALGTVPYALVIAWAGSRSTREDPMPAVWATTGIFGLAALVWFAFLRPKRQS